MKILLFCQLFPPLIYGGGETLFWSLAQSLVSRGHEVHVITQRIAGQPNSERRSDVHIHRVGAPADYKATLATGLSESLAYLGGAIFAGIRIIVREHIDIVHSNTYVPAVAALVCASILRKRHVMTVHDVYLASMPWFWREWSRQPDVGVFARIFGTILERVLVRIPVSVIQTVSETSKRDLLGIGARAKIVVVPNGIDVSEYGMGEVSVKPHQAIFIGRLVFYKNLEIVFRALAKVIQAIPEAKLIVVGDGPMRAVWERMVEDLDLRRHVCFYGRIPEERKLSLLEESAFLVLPSMVEGFGIVVLEAFACRKPVLASAIGALRELVSDEVDGYLVDPASETDWANRMIMLFEDSERARRMGLMGWNRVVPNFTMDRVAAGMENLYANLLDG
jgi:glycosyltransferase involved in cell wall biosynthesis